MIAHSKRGYSSEFRQICLKEYAAGKSARAIERDRKVHHTTVLLWARSANVTRQKVDSANDRADHTLRHTASATETKLAKTPLHREVSAKSSPNSASSDADLSSRARSQTKAAKAEIILRSALEIFSAHGYTAASMSRIAARAGVSKPTLYRYFESKKGLFTTLIEQVLVKAQHKLLSLEVSSQVPASLSSVLRQLARVILTKLSEEDGLFALMRLVIGESGRFPAVANLFVSKVEKPIFEKIAAYLRFHPDVQTDSPMAMARIFVGTLSHYLIVQNLLGGKDIVPLESERLVEELVARMVVAVESGAAV